MAVVRARAAHSDDIAVTCQVVGALAFGDWDRGAGVSVGRAGVAGGDIHDGMALRAASMGRGSLWLHQELHGEIPSSLSLSHLHPRLIARGHSVQASSPASSVT